MVNRHILSYSHHIPINGLHLALKTFYYHGVPAICFISLSHATQNSQRLLAVHFGKLSPKQHLENFLSPTTGCGKLACKGGYR